MATTTSDAGKDDWVAAPKAGADDWISAPKTPEVKFDSNAERRRSRMEDPDQQSQMSAVANSVGQGLVSATGSGIAGVGRRVSAAAADNTNAQLAVISTIDNGGKVPDEQDFVGYQYMSSAQRAKVKEDLTRANVDISEREPNALTRAGTAVEHAAPALFPVDPTLEGRGTSVGRMVGGIAPAMAAGAAGTVVGGPVGAIMASAALIGSQSYAGTYQEALDKGATPSEAEKAAGDNAVAQIAVMSVPLSKVIPLIPVPLREGFLQTIARVGLAYSQRSFEMGAGNTLGSIVQNYIASETFDPGRSVFEGTGDATIDGLLAGLVVHGAASGAGRIKKNVNNILDAKTIDGAIDAATDIAPKAAPTMGEIFGPPTQREATDALPDRLWRSGDTDYPVKFTGKVTYPERTDQATGRPFGLIELPSGARLNVPMNDLFDAPDVAPGAKAPVPSAEPVAGETAGAVVADSTATPVRTVEEAKKIAAAHYARANEDGGILNPNFANKFLEEISVIGNQTEEGLDTAGKTTMAELKERLENRRDKPITLAGAMEMDKIFGDLVNKEFDLKGLSEEGRNIFNLQTKFRDMIRDAGPDDVIGGTAGFEALKQARAAWAQAMKMADLERIQTRAELSDNGATVVRSGIRNLLSNPSRVRGYTPEEIAGLKTAMNRGAVGSALAIFGNRLIPIGAGMLGFSGGVVGSVMSAVGGSAVANAAQNLNTRHQLRRLGVAMEMLGEGVPPMPGERSATTEGLAPQGEAAPTPQGESATTPQGGFNFGQEAPPQESLFKGSFPSASAPPEPGVAGANPQGSVNFGNVAGQRVATPQEMAKVNVLRQSGNSIIRSVGGKLENLTPEQTSRLADLSSQISDITAGVTQLEGPLSGQPPASEAAPTPHMRALKQTESDILSRVDGVEDDLAPEQAMRLRNIRSQLENPVAPNAVPGPSPSGRVSPQFPPMTVYSPTGMKVTAHPEVVELSSLIASQLADGKDNPNFPPELQPRDRKHVASTSQISKLAGTWTPELQAPSPNASMGPPMVGPDNVVDAGNGRKRAADEIYTNDVYANQRLDNKEWLISKGYDISGMSQPFLILRRTSNLEGEKRAQWSLESNERTTLGMNAAETARGDVARAAAAIGLWKGGDVGAVTNREFVRGFMSLLSKEEHGTLLAPKGGLSADGVRRIQNAVMAHAYGDEVGPVLDKFLSGDNEGMRRVSGGMSSASGDWAMMRDAAAKGRIPANLDITKDLASALDVLARSRELGQSVGEVIGQVDFDRPALSPNAQTILRAMFQNDAMKETVGSATLAERLTKYADEALKTPPGDDMFGTKPPTATELLATAMKPKPVKPPGVGRVSMEFVPTKQGQAVEAPVPAKKVPDRSPLPSRPPEAKTPDRSPLPSRPNSQEG